MSDKCCKEKKCCKLCKCKATKVIITILLIVGVVAAVHHFKCNNAHSNCPFHFNKEEVEVTVEVPAEVETPVEVLEDIVVEIESAE